MHNCNSHNLEDSHPEQCLTGPKAAAFLACSVHTLENWRLKGQGPAFIRQGRLIRYRLKDLIAFQERNRQEPEEKA